MLRQSLLQPALTHAIITPVHMRASHGCPRVPPGLMNDFFTDHLVPNFAGFKALGGTAAFTSLPRFFSMSGRQMRTIQAEVFDEFLRHDSHAHAFLLGSRTHVRARRGAATPVHGSVVCVPSY